MKYNPALDGVRAIAVAMVLGFHAFVPRFSGGYLGVDVFFVLSGFLISTLLLNERCHSGTIAIRRFYARRLVRLTPALALMVLVYLLAAPRAWPEMPLSHHLRDAAIALFYLSDYASAIWGVPVLLRHTWSLAVEEHFYVLWPLVVLGFLRFFSRKNLMWLLAVAYVVATAWRIYCDLDNGQGYDATYYRFDTRLSGLIAGSFLATLGPPRCRLSRGRLDVIASIAIIVIGLCTWRFTVSSTLAVTVGMTCIEMATVVGLGVLLSSRESWAFKLLANPAMVFLGRMSYGMYLWHYPIFHYFWDRDPWYLTVALGGSLSLLMAVVSHMTVERFARRLFGVSDRRKAFGVAS